MAGDSAKKKTYGNDPWDYPQEALRTLCEDCHEEEYLFRAESEKEILQALKMKGFDLCQVYELAKCVFNLPPGVSPEEFVSVISGYVSWEEVRDSFKSVLSAYCDQENTKGTGE